MLVIVDWVKNNISCILCDLSFVHWMFVIFYLFRSNFRCFVDRIIRRKRKELIFFIPPGALFLIDILNGSLYEGGGGYSVESL